jgi:two-component system, chemotaxis family, chemotaxis protein CheY
LSPPDSHGILILQKAKPLEKSMKILLVEDSNTLRYMFVKMLRDLGYKDLTAVASAEEAMPVLSNDKFDLAFFDWNLPKMSGFDLLRYVRASPPIAGLNVVMVTTVHERSNIIKALQVGLQGYLLKPLQKDTLLEKIKEIEGKLATPA